MNLRDKFKEAEYGDIFCFLTSDNHGKDMGEYGVVHSLFRKPQLKNKMEHTLVYEGGLNGFKFDKINIPNTLDYIQIKLKYPFGSLDFKEIDDIVRGHLRNPKIDTILK